MINSDGMEEIKQLFFEESDEGLDTMETGLLNLQPGTADMEVINNIFRAAHSIKGGSATFGFSTIAEFTHGVETILDEMRSGTRAVSSDVVDLLLKSVDCLRELMDAAKSGVDESTAKANDVGEQIAKLLDHSKSSKKTPPKATAAAPSQGSATPPRAPPARR